jgi:AraC-like DNA-binding protein
MVKKDATRSYSDYLLAILVLFHSWNVIIYLLLHYKLIIEFPYLFKTAAPLAFGIPPLAYLYIRSVLYNEKGFQLKDIFHYLLLILVFINYFKFYRIPINEKKSIVIQVMNNMDLSFTYQAGIIPEQLTNIARIVQLLFYVILSWSLLYKYKKNNQVIQIENQIKDVLKWLKLFAWTYTSYVFAYFIIIFIFIMNVSLFNSYSLISLLPLIIFTVGFFITSSYLLVHPNIMNGLPFIKYREIETNILTEENTSVPFIEEDYSEQIEKIRQYFEQEKPYLNKNLSLNQASVELGLPVREVSYIINNYYNNRFTDFVNGYRINYIIEQISSSYLDQYTIESLALEAGFISKSGFYKSFKKLYNTTPTEYFESMEIK